MGLTEGVSNEDFILKVKFFLKFLGGTLLVF
jgi:hypothetical protein